MLTKTRVYGLLAATIWFGSPAGPAATDPDLDCARPAEARTLLGRLMLAEIEGAEDIRREALWDAFGGCPAGGAGEPCRDALRREFGSRWDREKAAIQAKYREMLADFDVRCRGQIG